VLGRVVEPHVVKAFLAGLGGMRAEASARTEELVEAERAHDRAQREVDAWRDNESLADLGEDYVKGLKARVARRDRALDDLDQARTQAGVANLPEATDLEAAWDDLGIADQRHLLASGLDGVFIRCGRMPIAERTRILWKGEGPSDLPGPGRKLGLRSYVWD
jgi:hypothetical protein